MSGDEDNEREFWGQIVFPIIAERVEYLSTRLTPAQHRDYESVKEVVLEELRLSPLEYQKRFLGARKRKSETWKSFTTRLRSYLNFYVEARGVSTFEKLLDLLVADQLKTGLTEEALKYVRLREGASWFDASESAKLLQTFEGAAGNKDASAEANVTNGEKPATKPSGDNPKGARKLPQGPKTRFNQQSKGKPNACFECGAEGHLRPNCPRVRERQTAATNASARTERLIARVATEGPTGVGDRLTSVTMHCGNQEISAIVDTGAEITVVRESIVPDALTESHGTVKLASAFGEQVEAKLVVLPLALRAGQAIFSNVGEGTPVLCALTDKLTSRTDCLLSAEDWGVLQENRDQEQEATGMVAPPTKRDELVAALELNEADAPQETLEQGEENANEAVTGEVDDDAGNSVHEREPAASDTQVLRAEQKGDATLEKAWRDAADGKGGMLVIDGLLYHRDKVLGEPIKQLVLPVARRRQVPLAESSQLATAFVSHMGQFAWRVMPFGLRNAAASFQRIMNQLLAPHEGYACAYLDDTAVFSESLPEHLRHLDAVFATLASVGLWANLEKCQIAQSSIRYLGHVVGSGKHGPDPAKLEAIKGLKVPQTKKELRSALGLSSAALANISLLVLID
ncbi:uncharacterized protein LOC144172605 [Haemaphysalis longicornis]